MAKICQGIYGGISGKLGNTVGASWKGIHYLRIMPASVTNPNTPKQQVQRAKFLSTIRFLQPLQTAVKIGFKDYAVKMSAFNSAFSYTIKNAITGTFPNYTVNYPSALLSRGKLTKASTPAVVSTVAGKVELSWEDNVGNNALSTDKALIAIFNPEKNEAVIETNGSERADVGQMVVVPASFAGDTVHTWIAFVSADGQLVSDSVYAGEVTVAS